MATIVTDLHCDLTQNVKPQFLHGNLFSQDNAANTINVHVFNGGEPAALGGSISANVIRSDGATVAVSGAIDGNKAYIILPQACYAVPGVIKIIIKNTESTTVTTIAAVVANVYASSTDTVVDPGQIIPSVAALIAEIEAAVDSIPVDYSGLLATIAGTYSSSKTYKVGDYAWEAGVLKRCIVPITAGETFTAAHWTNAVIGDDLSALKGAIDPIYGGTKNLFDISLLKDATGITLVDGTTEFYGKASNMNFEISPNGIAILNGFPENQRFTVSAEAYNANATGTGLGVRCRVYYTDETDDYLFAWSRNTSEYTAKSVTTAQGKTVEKIKFNYSSGGSDIWHIKNLQVEPGTAKTDYAAFSPTAIDQVARGNTSVVDNRTGNIDEAESNLFNGINVIDQTLVSATTRISKDTGAASSNSGTFATHFIPIREGMKLTMNKIVDSGNYGTAFYDINKVFIEGYASTSGNKVLYAPKGAAFVRMTFLNGDLETATAVISAKVIDEAKAFTVINQKTKWIAVGDSITFGVYSKFVDGGGTDTGTFDGWVRLLAAAMNYDITVMASKGMGYTASVTGQDPEGGDTRISISTLLDRIVALEGDYNLITVSFGINDYNNPSQSTLQTILAGLDEAIQKLATRFKFARLVVITPFNSSRYGDGTTNYCYNYERSNNLSIKDIADAIKERCAYYGVECIYASNGFLLNNYNIETLLPDGVHPAKETHALIAKNMAKNLVF